MCYAIVVVVENNAPSAAALVRAPKDNLIREESGQKIDDVFRDLLLLFFLGDIVVVGKMAMSKVAGD